MGGADGRGQVGVAGGHARGQGTRVPILPSAKTCYHRW